MKSCLWPFLQLNSSWNASILTYHYLQKWLQEWIHFCRSSILHTELDRRRNEIISVTISATQFNQKCLNFDIILFTEMIAEMNSFLQKFYSLYWIRQLQKWNHFVTISAIKFKQKCLDFDILLFTEMIAEMNSFLQKFHSLYRIRQLQKWNHFCDYFCN